MVRNFSKLFAHLDSVGILLESDGRHDGYKRTVSAMGGASLVVSESAWSLSSAFLYQALLHDLFIQTI
jgi:hypothetical protein